MLVPHVKADVVGEHISGHLDALVTNDPSKGKNGDLRSSSADIDDHIAFGLLHIDPDPDRCRHGFVDEVDLLGTCVFGRIPNRSFFHFRDA